MAFTGSPVLQMISDRKVLVTGVSLAGGASGTIACSGGTGNINLPAGFQPHPYTYGATGVDGGAVVNLAQSIMVTLNDAAVGVTTRVPIAVVKTGDDPTDFVITLTNTTVGTASPLQEIFIEFH
jgi:hypothetical protein